MAISVIDSNSIQVLSNSTSITLGMPTHSPGDLLVAIISSGGVPPDNTLPAGWVKFVDYSFAPTYQTGNVEMHYKFADGSEGSSLTITPANTTNITAAIVSLSGVDVDNPIDTTAETGSTSTSRPSPDLAPQVTTSEDNAYVMYAWTQLRTWGVITKPALDDDIATEVMVSPVWSNSSDIVVMGETQAVAGPSKTPGLGFTNAYRSGLATVAFRAGPSGINIDDTRGAITRGHLSANAQRTASIRGQLGVQDTRAAMIQGRDSFSSLVSATITGIDSANNQRSAEIIGSLPANDSRGATTPAAYDYASNNRYATIHGGVISPQYAVSKVLTDSSSRRIAEVIIYPKEVITPDDSYVEYEITTNGTDWEPIQPETLYAVQNQGNALQWRIILYASSDGKSTPSVGYLSTVWTVIPSDPADDQRSAILYAWDAGESEAGATLLGYLDAEADRSAILRGFLVHTLTTSDTTASSDKYVLATAKEHNDDTAPSDDVKANPKKAIADELAAVDHIQGAVQMAKADTTQTADQSSLEPSKRHSDSAGTSEHSHWALHKFIEDIVQTIDATPRALSITRHDVVDVVDNTAKAVQKLLEDSYAAEDGSSLKPGIGLLDVIKLLDDNTLAIGVSASDTATATDYVSPVAEFHLKLEDSATPSDHTAKLVELLRSGSVDTADRTENTVGLNRNEDAYTADESTRSVGLNRAYTVVVHDAILRGLAHHIVDQVTGVDVVAKYVTTITHDTAGAADAVRKLVKHLSGDSVEVSDEFARKLGRYIQRDILARHQQETLAREAPATSHTARKKASQSDTIKARRAR